MATKTTGSKSIIAAVGGILIGAAILLFVTVMILESLKGASSPGDTTIAATDTAAHNASAVANRALWNSTNATFGQLQTFLTICSILLGILGIVIIGSTIIGAIGGGFGG